jgi:hypothetical protein
VTDLDAGVDDVGAHAGAVVVVGVRRVEREIALVDAIDAPRGAGLGRLDRHLAVFLDVRDARIGSQRLGFLLRELRREAFQSVLVDVVFAAAVLVHQLVRHRVDVFGETVFEHDDVLVLNLFAFGLDQLRFFRAAGENREGDDDRQEREKNTLHSRTPFKHAFAGSSQERSRGQVRCRN